MAVAAFGVLAISYFLTINRQQSISVLTTKSTEQQSQKDSSLFILTSSGEVSFNHGDDVYQLLPNSRFGFIGVWLVLQAREHDNKLLPNLRKIKSKPRQLFIYKDSLSAQDFSRVTYVINQL